MGVPVMADIRLRNMTSLYIVSDDAALCLYRVDAVGFSVNVLLAVYNLLPLRGNDGAVMLSAFCAGCGLGDGARGGLERIGTVLYSSMISEI